MLLDLRRRPSAGSLSLLAALLAGLVALAALAALALPSRARAAEEAEPPQGRVALGVVPERPAPAPGTVPPPDRAAEPGGAAPSPWWSAGFQSTYVWQRKAAFSAPYSGPKSLTPDAENGYTLTATLFLGARPWRGGELFFNPEVVQSEELSGLVGLAGLSNGEAQKSGGPQAKLYRARLFLRQTVGLGGEESTVEAGQNQLGGKVASRRLVITAGNFSAADVFDGNAFSHDPRTQFLNWSLMAFAASDYAADVRGYTWGIALEYFHDDWVFRAGRFAQPKVSNGLDLDLDLLSHYGDSLEIEHGHVLLGQPGKVRLAGFRNQARMGAFGDALRLAAASGEPPDFALVRREHTKYGFGVGLEQNLLPDVGVFARYSYNDGQTETYAFTEVERSLMAGVSVKGTRWRRAGDTAGVAFVQNQLSPAHQAYVEAQGAGLFIGDGRITYRPERIVEAYYSFNALQGFWFSLDAQHVANPAYNADRGPVNIIGCRIHVEH